MVTSLTGSVPNPLVHYYFDLYVISSGSIQRMFEENFPITKLIASAKERFYTELKLVSFCLETKDL